MSTLLHCLTPSEMPVPTSVQSASRGSTREMLSEVYERHSLLLFTLQHYGFPDHFVSMVRNYYDRLSVVIDVPGNFTTKSFHFALGVFQRCTLSPTLLNIVLQIALDLLEQPQSFGYTSSRDLSTSLFSSAYADDVQLVTGFREQKQYQRLLDTFATFFLSGPAPWQLRPTNVGL